MAKGLSPVISEPSIFQGHAQALTNTTSANYVNTNSLPVQSSSAISSTPNYSGGLISGVLGLAGQIYQNEYNKNRAAEERQWSEDMMAKQNAWSLDMWNRTNEYNSPSAQVQRLREAGLNPMYYGLDGSSANSFESAAPLGYERANMDNVVNPMVQGLQSAASIAQIKQSEAATEKIKSETDSNYLDNEFKRRTMNARVEGQELANSLTKSQIREIESKRQEIAKRIGLIAAQTDSEEERKFLLEAQRKVADAQAQEIVQLLPYRQKLLEAETEAQKAQASLAFWNASIQEGLFNGGYVEFELNKLESEMEINWKHFEDIQADIDLKTARKDIERFKARIRNGDAIDIDSIPKWMLTAKSSAFLWNKLLQRGIEVSEAMSGVLGPIVGFAVGKGASSSARSTGSVTNLYGPNGQPASSTKW